MTAPRRAFASPLAAVVLAVAATMSCSDDPGDMNKGGPSLAPRITQITPNAGPTDVAISARITGSNFLSGATVKVDGSPVNATVVNTSQIDVTMPLHAAGRVDIVVSNRDGVSATLTGG
jgi:uncharacterized protein (TIGR03437 family)